MAEATTLTPLRKELAGAALFDSTARQLGRVSAESFDRDGIEDRPAMVAVLQMALQTAMAQDEGFRFGFLLPLADLIDAHRMRLVHGPEWSGTALLHQVTAEQRP